MEGRYRPGNRRINKKSASSNHLRQKVGVQLEIQYEKFIECVIIRRGVQVPYKEGGGGRRAAGMKSCRLR